MIERFAAALSKVHYDKQDCVYRCFEPGFGEELISLCVLYVFQYTGTP